jgi:NitT/TauT family transport system substrate-binding protein
VRADQTKVTIGTARDMQLGAEIGMAKHKGYFAEEGLDVTVAYFGSGAEMTSAMAAGQLQIGSFGDFPTVNMIAADLPVKIISAMAEISGAQQIVVRDGIKSPDDLKGKKLGLMVGSSSESLLRSALDHYGIPVESVELVNMRPPEQVAALARGDVDGLAVWQPFVLKAKSQAGGHTMLSALKSYIPGMEGDLDFYAAYALLVARNDFLAENPDTTKALLRALYKAQKYINANKGETATTMQEDMRAPESDLRVFLDESVYDMSITPKLVRTLNNSVAFMYAAGKIKTKPKIEAYIDSSYLKSVDQALVK